MEVFRSDFSAPKALSNNVIHSIQQADNNCLWISTHLGIISAADEKLYRTLGINVCCSYFGSQHTLMPSVR